MAQILISYCLLIIWNYLACIADKSPSKQCHALYMKNGISFFRREMFAISDSQHANNDSSLNSPSLELYFDVLLAGLISHRFKRVDPKR